jgi:signal peptidase I
MDTRLNLRKNLYGCLALCALFVALPLRIGVVLGNSMSPSLRNGSIYLLNRGEKADKIQSGDVVVFRRNGVNYIKRVVAVGGERVYVTTIPSSGRDELVMDWQLGLMRRAFAHPDRTSVKVIARKVPPGYCYVVGDHMSASVDSRDLGPIPTEFILGKLIAAPEPTPELDHLAVVGSAALFGRKS